MCMRKKNTVEGAACLSSLAKHRIFDQVKLPGNIRRSVDQVEALSPRFHQCKGRDVTPFTCAMKRSSIVTALAVASDLGKAGILN